MIAELEAFFGQVLPAEDRGIVDIVGEKERGFEAGFLQLRHGVVELREKGVILGEDDRRLFVMRPHKGSGEGFGACE